MSIDAVKIATSIAQPFVVAGTPFTLTTKITNAHEGPIEIMDFTYHIPYQVQWIHEVAFTTAYTALRARGPLSRLFAGSPWPAAAQAPGTPMVVSNQQTPGECMVTVQSGESTTYSFKAIVPRWLFAANAELAFEGRISYKHNNELHSSPFHVTFALRSPLKAITLGALAGSLMGSIAQSLRDQGGLDLSLKLFSSTALAMILAVIAVVFSSRKSKDVQPILTVEDFWGGLVVGFLLGYIGHQFFEKVVPVQGT